MVKVCRVQSRGKLGVVVAGGKVDTASCSVSEVDAECFGDGETELLDGVDLWSWCRVGEAVELSCRV